MQQVIVHAFHRLNEEVFSLRDMATHYSSECEVSFEFGVADGVEFNYLDEEELNRLRKGIAEKGLSALDFLCVVRYHVAKKGKRVPLKFDYYMLRFISHDSDLELRIFHQRGIRRVPVENLIIFITRRINEELSRNRLKKLDLKNLQAL